MDHGDAERQHTHKHCHLRRGAKQHAAVCRDAGSGRTKCGRASRGRVTHNDGPHPLFQNEGGIERLEEPEEEAVPLLFLAICQLHTAYDVQTIALREATDGSECSTERITTDWQRVDITMQLIANSHQSISKGFK